MAERRPGRRLKPNTIAAIAVVTVAAVLVGIAAVANGFDVKQTPLNDSSIWAIQAGDGQRYARVNTDLGELDTIKSLPNPTGVAQTAEHTLLYTQNNERVADADPLKPQDFTDEAEEYGRTPTGTTTVVDSDDAVAYLTAGGTVSVALINQGAAASPVPVDPYADDEPDADGAKRTYQSDAIAIGAGDILYSYSHEAGAVLRYDIKAARVLGSDKVKSGPEDAGSQLTVVGKTWALVAADGSDLWLKGRNRPVDVGLSDIYAVQHPSAAATQLLIADDGGLVQVDVSQGAAKRVVGAAGATLGAPAAPTDFKGKSYAAWMPSAGSSGTFWTSDGGQRPLEFGGKKLKGDAEPVFQTNGQRMILNDVRSGWVWTMPTAALVVSSQNWGVLTDDVQQADTNADEVAQVVDPRAPVAEDDQFGVRAGAQAALPVLLNDHDANGDVLRIVPDSVTGLSDSFGTISITENSQALAVKVAAGATGTATFSYAVNDGTTSDGLVSNVATVTLTVHPESENSAPVWCGVPGCLKEWPTPQVAPGGTARVPVLEGWVDPDGDPIFIADTVNRSVGAVSTTPDGILIYRHPNASETTEQNISIQVVVSDTRGATATKDLSILVTPTPRLTATPFAVTTSVGESVTIDPSGHIDGVTGSIRIASATVAKSAAGVTVRVSGSAPTFDFSADTAGDYLVNYTLADDVSDVLSTVRVTVIAPDSARLTIAPVTVFVRPQVDTRVDVFAAVSNPSNHVLLLSDARPTPAVNASLDVSVVGNNTLRVRGTTADEQPGLVGTVGFTVSDGSADAAYTVQGEATVYLLPSSVPQVPIAAPDRVVVRAGALVNIPVLDNDTVADGNQLVLNPDSIVNPSGDGLAFASGSVVRYLAPAQAGTYELRYSIYVAGAPDLTDTAEVTVVVTPDGADQKPQPVTLNGRVLSGQSVRIPFSGYGIDPDGDEVLLDRIVDQPTSGTAALSATGDAIIYTSVIGFHGAVQFSYQVRDGHGETATALVRIGVLDAQADPSPITFSDYVQVQVGKDNKVVVHPIANDIDPTGGQLTLGDVVPLATKGTSEYDSIASHLISQTDDSVVLGAGMEAGLVTFTYSVKNSRGDIGQGLIVMKVVREVIPDYPVIADTVLSLDDRDRFAKGIDVVTDKVTWASGDVSDLTLSIYGPDHGVKVKGWDLQGDLPADGLLLPFKLSGTTFSGVKVASYGFLRIPAIDDVILSLRPSAAEQKVKEKESVTFDISDLVAVPDGSDLEVDAKDVVASGQRANAGCTATGTSITYAAGADQPWSDSCIVPVRLAGQSSYTHLAVPISITPEDPEPELSAAALTLSPAGGPTTYDLKQMVTWQGREDWPSLKFAIAYSGESFTASLSGTILTVEALDTAVPGRENTVTVSLPSHPKAPSAPMLLKVGPAPSSLPKGGTVAKECSQAAGSSCVITVIGAPGEANIYASTPLQVVSVSSPASCIGVTFAVENATSVRASWSADAPGATCTASFVVSDAQSKQSAGDRNGSVTLDLQGYPKAPNAVTQTGFNDGSATLTVSPGDAARSHPALQGFKIYRGGAVVASCGADGSCPAITGLTNDEKNEYTAKAFNATGESLTAVATTAWAYSPPTVGAVSLNPTFDAGRTTVQQGVAQISIRSGTSRVDSYDILIDGSTQPLTSITANPGTTTSTLVLPPGQHRVTVRPLSLVVPPPNATGPATGTGQGSVVVAGSPSITSGASAQGSDSSITVSTPSVDNNSSGQPNRFLYVAQRAGQGRPSCSGDGNGGVQPVNASATSTSPSIQGIDKNRIYYVAVCYSNGYGAAFRQVDNFVATHGDQAAPGNGTYNYTLSATGDNGFQINDPNPQSPAAPDGWTTVISDSGDVWGQDPGISAKYCLTENMSDCTGSSDVTPTDPKQAWRVRVDSVSLDQCRAGSDLNLRGSGPGATMSSATLVATSFTYWTVKAADPPAPADPGDGTAADPVLVKHVDEPGSKVPAAAVKVDDIKWSASWAKAPTITGTLAGETGCTP